MNGNASNISDDSSEPPSSLPSSPPSPSSRSLRSSTGSPSSVRIPRNTNELKQLKIAALYMDKSWEYYHRAREMFVTALRIEYEKDGSRTDDVPSYLEALEQFGNMDAAADFEPYMNSLSNENLEERQTLFHGLFLGTGFEIQQYTLVEKTDSDPDPNPDQEVKEEERTLTLEERLASLNSSLPSKMKSEEERMKDIQSGLDNLGVYVPSNNSSSSSNHNNARNILMGMYENNISEEDQIDQIMAMAKDEAMLDAKRDGAGQGSGSNGGGVNDIMELLKKANIRIDLDEEHYKNDSFEPDEEEGYSNDPEMAFWKNAVPTEETDTDDNNAMANDNSVDDDEPKSDIDKMRKSLRVAQQMLLQAKLCLDEYEEQQQQQPLNHHEHEHKHGTNIDDVTMSIKEVTDMIPHIQIQEGNEDGENDDDDVVDDVDEHSIDRDSDSDSDSDGHEDENSESTRTTSNHTCSISDDATDASEDRMDEHFDLPVLPAPPTSMPSSRTIADDALSGDDDDDDGSGVKKIEESEEQDDRLNTNMNTNTNDDPETGSSSDAVGLNDLLPPPEPSADVDITTEEQNKIENIVQTELTKAQHSEDEVVSESTKLLNDGARQKEVDASTDRATEMGRENLQEAQELLRQVLQLWPN